MPALQQLNFSYETNLQTYIIQIFVTFNNYNQQSITKE